MIARSLRFPSFAEKCTGFGRRLSATSDMIDGFFNMVEDLNWECESQPLNKPDVGPTSQSRHTKENVFERDPFWDPVAPFPGIVQNIVDGIEIGVSRARGSVFKDYLALRQENPPTPLVQEIDEKGSKSPNPSYAI